MDESTSEAEMQLYFKQLEGQVETLPSCQGQLTNEETPR